MTRIRTLPSDRKIGPAGAAPICSETSADALMDHLPVPGIPAGPSRTCRLYPGACRRLPAPGEIASLVGVRIRVGLILTWEVTRRCQGDGLGGGLRVARLPLPLLRLGVPAPGPGLLGDKYVWSLQVTGYPYLMAVWRGPADCRAVLALSAVKFDRGALRPSRLRPYKQGR